MQNVPKLLGSLIFIICTLLSPMLVRAELVPITDSNREFVKTLQIILTDGSTIEQLTQAAVKLQENNHARYNLTPLLLEIETQSRVRGNDFFRILGMVEAAAKCGISEVADILLERMQQQIPQRIRAGQWLQVTVESLMILARQQQPVLKKEIQDTVVKILMSKYYQSSGLPDFAATAIYLFAEVDPRSSNVILFVKRRLNSKSVEVRKTAASTFVRLASPGEIAQVLAGRGISNQYKQEARFLVIKSLSSARATIQQSAILLPLIEAAAQSDSSPMVRKEAARIVENIRTKRDNEAFMAAMTPEDRTAFLDEAKRLLLEMMFEENGTGHKSLADVLTCGEIVGSEGI